MGFILSDLGTDFERIADHCSNIAVCIIEGSEGLFDTHEYLGQLKAEKNHDFEVQVDMYERKYRLPAIKRSGEDEDEINPSFAEDHEIIANIMNLEEEKEPKSEKKKDKAKKKKQKKQQEK